MGFKEVNSLEADTTTAIGGVDKKTKKTNPVKAEGYFLGTKLVESAMSQTGTCKLHIIQTPKGNLGVWGKTDLDRKIAALGAKGPGSLIRITFTGKQPVKGKQDMYKYKLEVDSFNRIDVPGAEDEGAAADFSDEAVENDVPDFPSDDLGDDLESELDGEEAAEDEVEYAQPVRAAKPTAAPDEARQDKVKALLAQGRSK